MEKSQGTGIERETPQCCHKRDSPQDAWKNPKERELKGHSMIFQNTKTTVAPVFFIWTQNSPNFLFLNFEIHFYLIAILRYANLKLLIFSFLFQIHKLYKRHKGLQR